MDLGGKSLIKICCQNKFIPKLSQISEIGKILFRVKHTYTPLKALKISIQGWAA